MFLKDYQLEAIGKMKNGCILNGGVGSGKSRTALAYYFLQNGGKLEPFEPIDDTTAKDLYIITTAHKRDLREWDLELTLFLLSQDKEQCVGNVNIVVDSWNNIAKYKDVENAFFIFDEQRLVGSGMWVKTFYKIAKKNEWILLSATPGDTWNDYIPVFVANGFYKNKSEFIREHVVYSRYITKYPKIDRYINTRRLVRLRDSILVSMEFERQTVSHHEDVMVDYPKALYRWIVKERKDIETNEPLRNASELCYQMRKIVNSDPSRIEAIQKIVSEKRKVIIFYNFDYELEILRDIYYGENVIIAEWNGHKHQEIPTGDDWVYLVQYTAGCEGWNSTTTDTIIFYSQNYSYKVLTQACGRIDRLTTPYTDLYYYHLRSYSSIDAAIHRALENKKKFNEGKFISSDF